MTRAQSRPVFVLLSLSISTPAFAADPPAEASAVVAAGNGLVAAPPEGFVAPKVTSTWVSVLADCLEEARPGVFSVVDRSKEGATTGQVKADVAAVQELKPRVVVLGLGAHEMRDDEDPAAFVGRLSSVVGALRGTASGPPPAVFLVGLAAPTLSQLEWSPDDVQDQDVATRQATIDSQTGAWNAALSALASKDDGVWHVDLGWPSGSGGRGSLTRGGWALTDRAHARIGAVICEEILKNLGNEGE